jgi:hypothetical protein
MKTQFDMGLRSGNFFGVPPNQAGPGLGPVQLRGARLGQIDQALRDLTLTQINDSNEKYNIIHAWIAAYSAQDPSMASLLGQYKDNFWSFSDLAESKQGEADYVYRNFSPDDTQYWNMVTQKDLGYVEDWRLAIDQLYEAIKLVDPSYLQPPIGRKSIQTLGPGAQGPGARSVPGVPAPKPGTLATPAPSTTLFTQKNVLIGAGVLAAVGIVAYAMA